MFQTQCAILRSLFCASLALMLAGCASEQAVPSVVQPSAFETRASDQALETSLLHLYRAPKLAGSAGISAITVDGRIVLKMTEGKASLPIGEGVHEIGLASGLQCDHWLAPSDCAQNPFPYRAPTSRLSVMPGEEIFLEVLALEQEPYIALVEGNEAAFRNPDLIAAKPEIDEIGPGRIETAAEEVPDPPDAPATETPPAAPEAPVADAQTAIDETQTPGDPKDVSAASPAAPQTGARDASAPAASPVAESGTAASPTDLKAAPKTDADTPQTAAVSDSEEDAAQTSDTSIVLGPNLSWYDAKSYCEERGLRLPTVAEARAERPKLKSKDTYLGIWTIEEKYVDQYVKRYQTMRNNGFTEGENASSEQRTACFP